MAAQKEHVQPGAIFGAITLVFFDLQNQSKAQKAIVDWWHVLIHAGLGAGIGALSGILPDILEPAYYPGHRHLLHSKSVLFLCMYLIIRIKNNSQLNDDLKNFLVCSLVGYVSHLFEDSQTPNGIPII